MSDQIDDVDDWLERNADPLDVEAQRDRGSESWERAASEAGQADLELRDGIGRWAIKLPDGEEQHEVVIAKTPDDDFAGACDCDGWRYHGEPCAHICAIAQIDALQEVVPVDKDRAEQLAFDLDPDPEPEVIETGEEPSDAANDADKSNADISKPDSAGQPQGSDGENRPATPSETPNMPDTAFAGELPDVPDQYVMELGGDTYIRRAGYARLARSAGFRLELEEVVGAHETDWQHSKYEARILDREGNQIANDVGTAHADVEDLANAEANLDELAATRAATRALSWATGEGLNAVAEVAEKEVQQAP